MRYPATRWQDALPTGSGIVGAMLYGNIKNDTILLNHDSLYSPETRPVSLDVSDELAEKRDMINSGRCREAAEFTRKNYADRLKEKGLSNEGLSVPPYQPLCSVFVKSETDGAFKNYRRGIDFSTGRTWMTYRDDSALLTRELFVSRITDTVFLRIRGSEKGAVSCRISIGETVSEQSDPRNICHSSGGEEENSSSQSISLENRILTFKANYSNGFSYGAVGNLAAKGGTVSADDESLVIEGADELLLRINLYCGEDADSAISGILANFAKNRIDFDPALEEHSALHSELFNRVSLNLGEQRVLSEQDRVLLERTRGSNEEMLMAAYDGEVPVSLIQRMFDYGRYLLISSSREGGWPANLQGIWNGDYAPAWNCDIHTDENVQMNYWPAMPGGLSETSLPLFEYFESFMDDFRSNARDNYGCRGIMVPLALTTNGIVTPEGYSNWTAGAGWIAQHFYDYYLFTGDTDFLRDRALPWLREIALFYEDFLIEGEDGRLTYIPSLSPENRPGNGNSLVSINATMDIAICREVLNNLCDGCEKLGIEKDGVVRWRSMMEKLPEYTINEDGALCEWLHPDFKDNYHHRHQSHLYPIFPGLEITEESNPEIYEAGRVAVEKRLVVGLTSQTGWSMAHMANSYARLGEGDRSLECLEILSRGSTGPNLFTYHNDWRKMGLTCGDGNSAPFQIDANFGITAAVLEMLVFSKPGLIKLLPALPAKWNSGKVTGICCRGGITVDMEWDLDSKSFTATLTSNRNQKLRLLLPEWIEDMKIESSETSQQDSESGYLEICFSKDKPLTIT